MPSDDSKHLTVDTDDTFRPRARTMSPSILRKLRPAGKAPEADRGSSKSLRRPASSNCDSSSEDLTMPHSVHRNNHKEPSLLVSILKRSPSKQDSAASLSGSLPELSIMDKYIDECIDRACKESLTFDREPLPKGSQDFESVMHELGSSQEDVNEPKPAKEKSKVNRKQKAKSKGSSGAPASPQTSLRRVRWSNN